MTPRVQVASTPDANPRITYTHTHTLPVGPKSELKLQVWGEKAQDSDVAPVVVIWLCIVVRLKMFL